MSRISDTEFQLIKEVAVILAMAFTLILQLIAPYKKDRQALFANWKVNFPLAALNAVLMGWLCGGCAFAVGQWTEQQNFGLTNWLGLSLPAQIVFGVLALDLTSYAWHRANHNLSWLWRFHAVHHTDAFFDASTAVRFHPGELLISLPVRMTVVAALGIPIVGILTFEVIFAASNFFEHTNVALGGRLERLMERVVVTPAIHRKHHSRKLNELNANYSTIFSVWDRLFGSYLQSSSEEVIAVGLPGDRPAETNVWALLVRPLK